MPLHGEFNYTVASCACSVYDFAGEPHPQNCKTVDRDSAAECMKLNCVRDLSIVPVYC